MSPLGLREYALIAVVLALGALGWRWWYLEGAVRKQADVLEAHQTALETANNRLTAMDAALAGKADKDAQERRATANRERQLDEVAREDAEVRAWADMPIPDRVRDIDAPGGSEAAADGADGPVRD